jgi:hypothetical protein
MIATPMLEVRRQQKPVELIPIAPPPPEQHVRRNAVFAPPGERRTRYSLPTSLKSSSPVGYRVRLPLTAAEAREAGALLSLERPIGFAAPRPVTEQELFEESSLGVLSARQSTNFRGQKQVTFGPGQAREIAALLARLEGVEAPVLDNASYVHVVLSRPYRTPFTLLLTLVGHHPLTSPLTVAKRAWNKRVHHEDDIPTIGFLRDLHLGVLADAMERASIIASAGRRRAQVLQRPFCGQHREANRAVTRQLEALCGLTFKDRLLGWRVSLVAQVGEALESDRLPIEPALYRKLGANLLSFRSERIQPGVNQEPSAPPQYRQRQDMDVPDELTAMAGRAAYNAFAHWTGCDRERAKELLLLERVDVLTPNGKERLRQIRDHLNDVSDRVVRELPLWADLPTGRMLSRSAQSGRKAFGLAGQRIYIGGLSRAEIGREGLDWDHAVRAVGAAASRSALVAELSGVVGLPSDCDMLAGCCLMAGPVNQNDIGKTYFGAQDLLTGQFPGRDPTSLLVWSLKAKTVTDPIGNEEQLLNAAQQGTLVDLRPGPHDAVRLARDGQLVRLRQKGEQVNAERAFGDQRNFVTDATGADIPGNRGELWPDHLRHEVLWK